MSSSRRVSLPATQLTSISNRISPSTSRRSPRRKNDDRHCSSTTVHRRSLPETARYSPRRRVLPHVNEYSGASADSENSYRHPSHFNSSTKYKYSLTDSGFMETNNNVCEKDDAQHIGLINGRLRSFDYKHGLLIDNGYEFRGYGKPIVAHRGETRRATCPEIYLQPELNCSTRQVIARVYGSRNCGKKTLAHQLYHLSSTTTPDQIHFITSETDDLIPKTSNFLLNGEEIRLEIVLESKLESSPFTTDQLTIYIIAYSVDSRESFRRATSILYRIYQSRTSSVIPVVLVGNKIDLKRNIVVSTIEGKSLAKIYKCGFVEVSALLSMNIEEMWKELIRQIQNPSDYKPPDHSWMHRLLLRGRHIAKSCEELVQRIIT